jgi:hypothetical protein
MAPNIHATLEAGGRGEPVGAERAAPDKVGVVRRGHGLWKVT